MPALPGHMAGRAHPRTLAHDELLVHDHLRWPPVPPLPNAFAATLVSDAGDRCAPSRAAETSGRRGNWESLAFHCQGPLSSRGRRAPRPCQWGFSRKPSAGFAPTQTPLLGTETLWSPTARCRQSWAPAQADGQELAGETGKTGPVHSPPVGRHPALSSRHCWGHGSPLSPRLSSRRAEPSLPRIPGTCSLCPEQGEGALAGCWGDASKGGLCSAGQGLAGGGQDLLRRMKQVSWEVATRPLVRDPGPLRRVRAIPPRGAANTWGQNTSFCF